MNSDSLNEKRAQEILDRLDKEEFVFTMNDLEGEEYVGFQVLLLLFLILKTIMTMNNY